MKQSTPQSPHWLDSLCQEIIAWKKTNQLTRLHVDDMKTPSGRVHTGALRGVLIHDLVYKVLQALGEKDIVYTYVFNDLDPMDSLPFYLDQAIYQQEMGKPLCKIPAPPLDKSGIDFSKATDEEIEEFKKCKSFSQFYALDFIKAFRGLGATPKIVWSHELYESGQMDEMIRVCLDKVDEFRKIYQDVADYQLPPLWYPFQVICPHCGKLGTTLVTAWDGQEVTFECKKDQVTWAEGCGYQGKISPFGGRGKLLWKADWPSHWRTLGVNVEGAGKDHSSAGGSRDMANAMCQTIHQITVPFDIKYEWILLRGAKMSSSKGVGTSAREFVELFPREVGRFLFTSKNYSSVIDFDPSSMAIPDLYDEYDQAARIFFGHESGDKRQARSFALANLDKPQDYFQARFRDLAIWMQHPEIDLINKFSEIKGSTLTELEKQALNTRKKHLEVWLERFAPEEFKLTPQTSLPAQANNLTTKELVFFQELQTLVQSKDNWQGDELQQHIYELAKKSLGAKQGFQLIYKIMLGKNSGPKAAHFILANLKIFLLRAQQLNLSQLDYHKESKP